MSCGQVQGKINKDDKEELIIKIQFYHLLYFKKLLENFYKKRFLDKKYGKIFESVFNVKKKL